MLTSCLQILQRPPPPPSCCGGVQTMLAHACRRAWPCKAACWRAWMLHAGTQRAAVSLALRAATVVCSSHQPLAHSSSFANLSPKRKPQTCLCSLTPPPPSRFPHFAPRLPCLRRATVPRPVASGAACQVPRQSARPAAAAWTARWAQAPRCRPRRTTRRRTMAAMATGAATTDAGSALLGPALDRDLVPQFFVPMCSC